MNSATRAVPAWQPSAGARSLTVSFRAQFEQRSSCQRSALVLLLLLLSRLLWVKLLLPVMVPKSPRQPRGICSSAHAPGYCLRSNGPAVFLALPSVQLPFTLFFHPTMQLEGFHPGKWFGLVATLLRSSVVFTGFYLLLLELQLIPKDGVSEES